MANTVTQITLGVDVSKAELVIHHREGDTQHTVSNHRDNIRAWLKGLPAPARLAVEPTSHYHFELVDQCHALGHHVFLVNPRQLVHYRESVGERHKSDLDDARLLARFLDREAGELRAFRPNSRNAQALWGLIKRRATVVEARTQLRQSLSDVNLPHQALMTQFKQILVRIDQRIKALIHTLGWPDDYRRCLSIPGIGPINAAALVCAFHRASFAGSDAFIAYLGLDVRRRESGTFKGKRKLTKRGEPALRRLLFCATQADRNHARFDNYYQSQLDKGLPKTAAKIILARKLARIAFTLMARQETFTPR